MLKLSSIGTIFIVRKCTKESSSAQEAIQPPRTLLLLEEDLEASPRAATEHGPGKLDAENFPWNQFQPVVRRCRFLFTIFSSFVPFRFSSDGIKFAHIKFLDGWILYVVVVVLCCI